MSQVLLAVVGFGLVGRRHADAIASCPEAKLAAIVEPENVARADALRCGFQTFSTINEMFQSIKPDGVLLASPTPLHVEQALACVEYRCPVLIEKPIAVQTADAAPLVFTALENEVPLLVGHHRRHFGVTKVAKAAIDDGLIGDVRAIQATCWLYKPDPYFAVSPWRTQKGAGPISVNLVHDVDLLRYFCGEVVEVTARAIPSRRGFENEDLAAAILTFESGALATISVSDSVAGPWSWELTSKENTVYPATDENCYLIGGSLGGLSVPDLKLWRFDEAPDWWSPIKERRLDAASADALTAQIAHFVRVIRGQEDPLVSGLEGLRSLQVVEAIQVSAETKRSIVIEPIGM